MTRQQIWQRNYAYNLAALTQPGALDGHYCDTIERLAQEYADADTDEGVVRPVWGKEDA